jgi:hypothetical protein
MVEGNYFEDLHGVLSYHCSFSLEVIHGKIERGIDNIVVFWCSHGALPGAAPPSIMIVKVQIVFQVAESPKYRSASLNQSQCEIS